MALRFVPFHDLERVADTPHVPQVPHVIVDGGPLPSTALTLSHWPGSPTPEHLLDDLSAQIVFHALDHPEVFDTPAGRLEVVSNNHFDQDGLASAFTLVDPDAARSRREQLIDVACAGDFATFTDRDSMRLAFALAAWADPDRSPLDEATFAGSYDEQCGRLYDQLLPRVPELLDDVAALRPWWEAEDAHLTESLDAIDQGVVTIDERPGIDLATVTVPDAWAERMTTRFTINRSEALHPAAVNAATDRLVIATVQGPRHRVECRYESWVMYRSRPVRQRPDLRLLTERLQTAEQGDAVWSADPPGALTPALQVCSGHSTLDPARFRDELERFLAVAAPAWNPRSPAW